MTTVEDFKEWFDKAQDNKVAITGKCHDCDAKVTINGDWDLESGEVVIDGDGSYYKIVDSNYSHVMRFFKCNKCYEKDPILRNYMPTEVYSRVTGYLRPVSQWNLGKQSEHETRLNFEVKEKCQDGLSCNCGDEKGDEGWVGEEPRQSLLKRIWKKVFRR